MATMPRRLLPVRLEPCALVLAFALAFGATPAHATSALFDFDDFPEFYDYEGPGWTDPYTHLYGCEGKSYCTAQDVYEAHNDNYGDASVGRRAPRPGCGLAGRRPSWRAGMARGPLRAAVALPRDLLLAAPGPSAVACCQDCVLGHAPRPYGVTGSNRRRSCSH